MNRFCSVFATASAFAAVLIMSLTAGAEQPEAPPTLPEERVTPPVDAAEPSGVLESVYDSPFQGALTDGYRAGSATTGTKIDVPLIDFPGSIQVLPRQVIDDQAATELSDLLHNVSGLNPSIGGSGDRHDDLLIRGFRVEGNGSDFRKNGFRDTSRVKRDLANVERIEVLKGPASVLYGATGQPSGIINLVTKKPLPFQYYDFYTQLGSYDQYRSAVDLSGPVWDSGNALYRLNMAVEDSRSFRDFVYLDRVFVAPVATFLLGEYTALTVEGEYLHDERQMDRGLPLFGGRFDLLPRSRFFGEPRDGVKFNDGQVGVFLDHRFSDDWFLRAGYVSNWSQEDRRNTEARPNNAIMGTTLRRRLQIQHVRDSNHYFIGDVTGDFDTGPLFHQVVVGTELGTDIRDQDTARTNTTNIDLLNPVYGAPQMLPTDPRFVFFQNDNYGLYVQDLIDLGGGLKGLAGVRYNAYRGEQTDTQVGPNQQIVDEVAWTPRFGLLYPLLEDRLALYGGYSESFQPVFGLTRDGSVFVPETGWGCEYGVKMDLLDERLFVNLAGFEVVRNNVPVVDPVDPMFDIQLGEARSRGVELDAIGEVTEWLSIVGNLAYTDARVSQDTDLTLLRNRLPNVPYYAASLWTKWTLLRDSQRELAFGFGGTRVNHRVGDLENTYRLPGYTRWDSGIYYRRGALELSVFAENILDEFYIASSRSEFWNQVGNPLMVTGTARIRY